MSLVLLLLFEIPSVPYRIHHQALSCVIVVVIVVVHSH